MDPFKEKEFELPVSDAPYLKELAQYCLNVFSDDPVATNLLLI